MSRHIFRSSTQNRIKDGVHLKQELGDYFAALTDGRTQRKAGVAVTVDHCPIIKPLDVETILTEARRHEGMPVFVAENHSVVGGLGESIAPLLMRNNVQAQFQQIGLPDEFLDAGALPTFHDRCEISTKEVVK